MHEIDLPSASHPHSKHRATPCAWPTHPHDPVDMPGALPSRSPSARLPYDRMHGTGRRNEDISLYSEQWLSEHALIARIMEQHKGYSTDLKAFLQPYMPFVARRTPPIHPTQDVSARQRMQPRGLRRRARQQSYLRH